MRMDIIHTVVCSYFEVDLDYPFLDNRKHDVIRLRQLIHYLARFFNKSKLSYEKIGMYYNSDFNHCTVMHSCKATQDRIETEREFSHMVDEIVALCRSKKTIENIDFPKKKITLSQLILDAKNEEELKTSLNIYLELNV